MTWMLLAVGLVVGYPAAPQSDSITVARLQYDGGGDWYANPSSLPNLLEAVRERTGIPVAQREVNVTPLDPGLRDHPYLYMTGHGNVRFTAAERAGLREYLVGGGFLHADDNYGLDESFREEIALIDGEPPQALGIFQGGRLLVFYSYESDLGDGWEDPDVHDDAADVREQALRMGVNLFVYVLGQVAP